MRICKKPASGNKVTIPLFLHINVELKVVFNLTLAFKIACV